jgi:hypothetical protein
MRRTRAIPIASLFLVLALAVGHAAKPKTILGDLTWTSPDLAQFPIASIAMLPPVTYDGNVQNRREVEQAVGTALKGSGHRWVSPILVRDYLIKNGGDTLTKAINDQVLKAARIDSLDAPRLSRILHARALLSVRVDEMERRELEADQSGRPSTSIQLKAALVDSTGRLLWTLASNETMEGAQQDPGGNIIGMKASGLNNTAVGEIKPAPLFAEVLGKMCLRWTEAFPKRAGPDSTASGK